MTQLSINDLDACLCVKSTLLHDQFGSLLICYNV